MTIKQTASPLAALLLSTVLYHPAAYAQAVPGSADSSRVQKIVTPLKAPDIKTKTDINVPESITGAAPKGADKVKFTLSSVTLDGMTAYSDAEIAPLYQQSLGQEITLADVFTMAAKLTAKYRNDGYILTQVIVPGQTIDTGTIKFQVVEGYIDQISIEGEHHGNGKVFEKIANHIRKDKPLNVKTLEHYLLILNEIPGLTVRSILSPSPDQPGAADLSLIVSQDYYNLFAEVNNRGSRFLGSVQANAAAQFNSVFGFNEAINIQVVTAPDGHPHRELDYLSASLSQNIGSHGTKIEIGGNVSATDPGHTLAPFAVKGHSRTGYVNVSHPFIRSRTKNLIANIRLDLNHIERKDNVTIGAIVDRTRVVRAGSTFQFADGLLGVNTISGEVSQGLNILNDSDVGGTNLTRPRGVSDFTKATAQVSRLQRVSDKVEVFAAVSGQKSANILLSSEEFGVGGSNFGGGYDNSEIVGEDGLAGKIELRLNTPAPAQGIDGYQLFSYFDGGKVWDPDNTVSKDRIRSVVSAGAGVRVEVNKHISGAAEVAVPLTRQVQTKGNNDPRFFFKLSSRL